MAEIGKTYKLTSCLPFVCDSTSDYKVLSRLTETSVVCQNMSNGSRYVIQDENLVEVEPSDLLTSILEDGCAATASCVGALASSNAGSCGNTGTAPCPTLTSGATVNGLAVAGTSVKPKKKKKKKHEDLEDNELQGMLYDSQAEENDAVRAYKERAEICRNLGQEVLAKLFDELAHDETVHKGCLQGALTQIGLDNPRAIMDGEEEAEEILSDIDSIEWLDEDFNEAYERITEEIARYLDKLNFEFANTEEIIYKKEGDNKYLFKFDNAEGIIKIKVETNGETLVEKEYKLEEEQDVKPIFDEIESIYRRYGL